MPNFLSVEQVFFTILGYPVSYLEFAGTILYLASVWLIARRNKLTWPVGIVSVILFMMLFYQFELYSDALEQIYYLAASAYGWWAWSNRGSRNSSPTNFGSTKQIVSVGVLTLVFGLLLGFAMTRVHEWLPSLFANPAALPWLDAMTTAMSFVAMWLLTLKRAESWVYWIIVDVAAIFIYFSQGIAFVALQYVLLTGIAILGLATWARNRSIES